jgi:hypothetical protein
VRKNFDLSTHARWLEEIYLRVIGRGDRPQSPGRFG